MCFQKSPKTFQIFWATFVRKFVAETFLKMAQSGHTEDEGDTSLDIGNGFIISHTKSYKEKK